MFQPQRVYVDNSNNQFLAFDTIIDDIKPLNQNLATIKIPSETTGKTNTPKMTANSLNNESDAMMRSIGVTFDADEFISRKFNDKKVQQKALLVLLFLTRNVDKSILHFTQAGGIIYQNNLVPNSDLVAALKNLVSKKSKTLQTGEYFLLSNLLSAPHTITGMINPSKLKLCNIQTTFKNQGPSLGSIPTATSKTTTTAKAKVQLRNAHPQVVSTAKLMQITKTKPLQPSSRLHQQQPNLVQTRFNAKTVPAWYKIL